MKKVTFNGKNKVFTLVAWNFAYREARKSDYLTVYINRLHFQRRIQLCEEKMTQIFSNVHRAKIYNERFNVITIGD